MGRLAWHRDMLADQVRVDALVGAVHAAVRPGDVVVDIGTGTGVLAVAAARAGARRVIAIDEDAQVLAVARQVIADNGLDDRVQLRHGRSTEVELEERADVVVAELVGSFGLEEEITRYLDDARRRFLVPGGRLVPDELRLLAAPTDQGGSLGVWARQLRDRHDIDLGAVDRRTRHLSSDMWADPERLLGAAGLVLACDLTAASPVPLRGRARSVLQRGGSVCGWVGWFEMSSGARPILSTRPSSRVTSWSQVFLSAGEPIAVDAGDEVSLDVRYDPPFWSWALAAAGTRRSFSELEAVPLPQEAAHREEAVPT